MGTHDIYHWKGGLKSLNISKIQVGKCDSFFGYEPKTTPTVKYRRWLNIISPKMH